MSADIESRMTPASDASPARVYLRQQLEQEYKTYFGMPPAHFFEQTVNAWMDDANNSKHRFDTIKKHLPDAKRVLDMASGCGSAVFYGLLNGYDMRGVDPEAWKHTFNAMKAAEYGYPREWITRFHTGVGESLPYEDDHFDCTTSYQTLEHVQDVRKALTEMLRVTRVGGGAHIHCPDYSSTFEGHYRLPWLPLFPRSWAEAYLRALGRPVKGLGTLNYTTRANILRTLRSIGRENPSWRLQVVDVERANVERTLDKALGSGARPLAPLALKLARAARYARKLFTSELTVDLFIYVRAK
jgi:ubiquinone/menaquinone biosynthesis C-methylase UbiE